MSAIFTISGENLKRMDATVRELAAMGISNAKLRFKSMAADELSFTIPATPAAGAPPEDGQRVSIFRSGVRIFHGEVVAVEFTAKPNARPVYQVEARGGWYFLEQTQLTSIVPDDAGGTKERPVVGVIGTIGVCAKAILARARTLGSPIADGVIDSGYTLPGQTYPLMSAAAALAEVLRWHAGMVTSVDYSGTTQKLNIRVRTNAPVNTLNAAAGTVTSLVSSSPVATPIVVSETRLSSRIQQKPAGIIISYATRNSTGKMVYSEIKNGSTAEGTKRRKVVVMSGPELDTYLPRQEYETVTVKTSTDPTEANADLPFRGKVWPMGSFSGMSSPNLPAPQIVTDDGLPAVGFYYLVGGVSVPDWFVKQENVKVQRAKWVGTIYTDVFVNPTNSSGAWVADKYPSGTATFSAVQGQWLTNAQSKSIRYGAGPTYTTFYQSITIPILIMDKSWGVASTIYRKGDYAYAEPPATLAADMMAAANFTPYHGTLQMVEPTLLATPWAGRTLNLAASAETPAEYQTMLAMVASTEHNLMDGRSTVRLGPPARHNFESLVQSIRRTPIDNIQWL